LPGTASPFTGIARSRRSPRQFLPTALSPSDIRGGGVLEDAQTAPSNSNTQPWTVHVVSGAARDALGKELLRAEEEGRTSPDFTDGCGEEGIYLERSQALGSSVYGSCGPPHRQRVDMFLGYYGPGRDR
jgi:nitroreductase